MPARSLDIEGWKRKLFRRSESQGTVDSAEKGLAALRSFLATRKVEGDAALQGWMDKLADSPSASEDVAQALDDFSSWLQLDYRDAKGERVMPRTVRNRVLAVRVFLRYHRVKVQSEDFKDAVQLPITREIEDEGATTEEVRTLCMAGTPLMRTFILTITSMGLRAGEGAALQVQDIDFNTYKPCAYVHIRAMNSKTDKPRSIWATDEATQALRGLCASKKPEDLVFLPHSKYHPNDTKHLRRYYIRLLKKAGLDKKIPGHKYYNLHLHNLGRKYFFSHALAALGEEDTHAIMGHKKWWAVYDRRPVEERFTKWRTNQHVLYIMQSSKPQDKVERAKETLQLLFPNEDFNAILNRLAQAQLQKRSFAELDQDSQFSLLQLVVQQRRTGTAPATPKYETTAVRNDDVEHAQRLIADGWEPVGPMNGSVIYRRQLSGGEHA